MADGEKRIVELTETQTFGNGDYLPLDNISNSETKKIEAKKLGITYTMTDTEDGFTFEGDNGYSHNVHIPDVEIEEKTASGEIATFDDGGENIPMKSVVCEINPIQDLHGYDSPWVGGAGKNKCNVKVTTQTKYGVTFTVNEDGSVKVEGTTNTTNVFLNLNYEDGIKNVPVGEWKIGLLSNDPNIGLRGYVSSSMTDTAWGMNFVPISVEEDATQSYVRIQISGNGTTVNTTVYPMILASDETDTTFEPYSNICPISGFTEANVVVSPTTDAEDGTTYTIQFKDGSNPLTVYGGSLDAISGELTVDSVKTTINDLNVTKSSSANYSFQITGMPRKYGTGVFSIISDSYKSNTTDHSRDNTIGALEVTNDFTILCNAGTKTFFICDSRFTNNTAEEFKAANKDVELVYELETPQSYQLTPTQVKSLLGTNNVWHDCNGGISIIYLKGNLGGYVYELDKQIENVDAKVENIKTELGTAELQTTDKTIKGAINELDARDKATVSDKYNNETGTYAVGDTAIYENELYVCNTAISTPEDFDSTKWDKMTLGEYCAEIKSNLTEIEVKAKYVTYSVTVPTTYTEYLGSATVNFYNLALNSSADFPTGKNILAIIPQTCSASSGTQRALVDIGAGDLSDPRAYIFGKGNNTYSLVVLVLYTE